MKKLLFFPDTLISFLLHIVKAVKAVALENNQCWPSENKRSLN